MCEKKKIYYIYIKNSRSKDPSIDKDELWEKIKKKLLEKK